MRQHIRVVVAAVPVALLVGAAVWGFTSDEPVAVAVEEPKRQTAKPARVDVEPRAKAQAQAAGQAPPVENPGGVRTVLPEGEAVVVPIGPNDEVPQPEREGGPVVENDPIEPELPQTPEWRLEKTVHMASLVDRQIGRLESALADAEAAGDKAEAQRLEVRLERQRKRLEGIREEANELREP